MFLGQPDDNLADVVILPTDVSSAPASASSPWSTPPRQNPDPCQAATEGHGRARRAMYRPNEQRETPEVLMAPPITGILAGPPLRDRSPAAAVAFLSAVQPRRSAS